MLANLATMAPMMLSFSSVPFDADAGPPVCEDTPGWMDNSDYTCETWAPSCAPDSVMIVRDPDVDCAFGSYLMSFWMDTGGNCGEGTVLLEYEPGQYWWYSMTDTTKTWLSTDVPGNCQYSCERC